MKKILYVMTSLSHKRCFEMFEERSDAEQMCIGPNPIITNTIVPEDYSDFGIRNIKTFSDNKQIQGFVDVFKPDVYVKSDMSPVHNIKLPNKCKIAFVGHGMVGSHAVKIAQKSGINYKSWRGCDLYCGASDVFKEWVKFSTGAGDDRILLNAISQLDIIHNSDYYKSYRNRILGRSKNPSAKKVILFVGFAARDRFDFLPHNEDYYNTVVKLEKLARKNNWLGLIKPRQTHDKLMKFLKDHKKWGWPKNYICDYDKTHNSNFLHFITTTGHNAIYVLYRF